MGFLDKILNAPRSAKIENEGKTDTNDSVLFYRNKYKEMELDGKVIDWWEFNQSVDKKWPYPVATEAERKAIESFDKQALRNHAFSISDLLYKYSNGMLEDSNDGDITVYKDLDKVTYWKNVLINGAEQGNRSFQAALVTRLGIYDGSTNGWIGEEERQSFIDQYESKLIDDAKAGDPNAMYAVAQFCLGEATYGSEYRRLIAEKAMNAGNGDAAFLCSEIYKSDVYLKGSSWEYSDIIKFYAKGVECNNGAMLGIMQDCIAEAYRDGEDGFPKDIKKAIYYYKLAVSNGCESAMYSLKFIEERKDLDQY